MLRSTVALLQAWTLARSTTRARALARALEKLATARRRRRSRVEEMQVMTFDSCDSYRKADSGPSPQLFQAMLSFLSASGGSAATTTQFV